MSGFAELDLVCGCYAGISNYKCIETAENEDIEKLYLANNICFICTLLVCKHHRKIMCEELISYNAHFCSNNLQFSNMKIIK